MSTPPGECRQCWAHSKQHAKEGGILGSFLGIGAAANKPCAACESHMGGCPPNMIEPRNSWWR